jgi:hypothetical protein
MSSKHLRRNVRRQPAPRHRWAGRAFDVLIALVFAVVCAVVADLWLRPAEARLSPCEAPLRHAVPAASPRCPVPFTAFIA